MSHTLILNRHGELGRATFGTMVGLSAPVFTLEDQWKNNQRSISCIPAGKYKCVPHGWEENSPFRFKQTWQLLNVPGRSAILFHAGNDHTNTKGCVLVGMKIDLSFKTTRLIDSGFAVNMMRAQIGPNDFMLEINDWKK